MRKKTLIKAISLIIAGVCVCGSMSEPLIKNVYARSELLEEEIDDKNAIKGMVRICAIFDDWHKNPVTVDLSPTFEGGVHHLYTLTPEQPEIEDMVAVGSYRTIAYLADEDRNYKNDAIRVFAQKLNVVVTESAKGEDIPSAVAIVGGEEFIKKYGYAITEYRNEKGKALSGIVTENEAIKVHENNIAKQNTENVDEEFNPNDIKYDNSNTQQDEQNKLNPEEIPSTEDDVKENKNIFIAYGKYIVLAIAVLGAATFTVWRKKNR